MCLYVNVYIDICVRTELGIYIHIIYTCIYIYIYMVIYKSWPVFLAHLRCTLPMKWPTISYIINGLCALCDVNEIVHYSVLLSI